MLTYSQSEWTGGTGILYTNPTTTNVGIGTTSPSVTIHSISTTEQLRLGYDVSNYTSFTVGSTGSITFAPTGTNPNITLTPGGTGYAILNGKVGIGTTNPGSKLTLSDLTTDISGTHNAFSLSETNNAMSDNESGELNGALISVFQGSANALNVIRGLKFAVTGVSGGTGTVSYATGSEENLNNNQAGTWSYATANDIYLRNSSSGTISNAYGLSLTMKSTGAGGTINNGYGLYLNIGQTNGNFNNAYGLYIPAFSGTIGNKYAIYQGGANDKNYFAGSVGIGTTIPGENLEISGNARISGHYKFTGTGTHYFKDEGGTASTDKFTFRFSDDQDVLTIAGDGNVGVGTSSPSQKLEIAHNDTTGGIALNQLSGTTYKSEIKFKHSGTELWAIGNDLFLNNDQNFFIWDHAAQRARFLINQNGNIGIGTTTPGAKLEINSGTTNGLVVTTQQTTQYGYCIQAIVENDYTKAFSVTGNGTENFIVYGNGYVRARDIHVKLGTLGDFIFDKNHALISISELENFINQNHHLPGIPSAAEVNEKGINVGDFQNLLLQKIEEQTLYIINLQKQIDELKAQMNASKNN